MLELIIAPVVFIFALASLLKYLHTAKQKFNKVPGPSPSDPIKGNIDEISDAGSMHQYLFKLHKLYGGVASFHFGKQFCVSIASPELFKEHRAPFDRPPSLHVLHEPYIMPDSVQFANGEDGRNRRNLTDRCFGYQALVNFVETFNEISEELVEELSALPAGEHIPLQSTGLQVTLKGITRTSFGYNFTDKKAMDQFNVDFNLVWEDRERRVIGSDPEPGSRRQKAFDEAKERLYDFTREIIKQRRAKAPPEDPKIFLDVLLQSGYPESKIFADVLTYVIGGFHTSGNLIAWALYFLAKDEMVQEKLCDLVTSTVGKTGKITLKDISDMKYLKQVIDETLRVSVLTPYTTRCLDRDITLGGYVVRKGTPVFHALGVPMQRDNIFPDAFVFDPDNFSPENVKKRHRYAFQPFGFAGKRVCPGQQFAYKEVSVYLAALIRAFRVKLVPCQTTEQSHGLVSRLQTPDGADVCIIIEKR